MVFELLIEDVAVFVVKTVGERLEVIVKDGLADCVFDWPDVLVYVGLADVVFDIGADLVRVGEPLLVLL